MAGPYATPSNGVVDFASMLAQLAPMFLGGAKQSPSSSSGSTSGSETGTTSGRTDTTTGVIDPTAMGYNADLLAKLMPQISGTDQTDAVVNSILRKAAIAFAPTIGAQNQAGIYNSTVLQMLSDEAKGSAVAQSADAVLKSQQVAAQTAQAVVGNLTNASKGQVATVGPASTTAAKTGTNITVTNPSVAKPLVNPAITGILSTLLLGRSAYKGAQELFGGFGKTKLSDAQEVDGSLSGGSNADYGIGGDSSIAGDGASISVGGGETGGVSIGSGGSEASSAAAGMEESPLFTSPDSTAFNSLQTGESIYSNAGAGSDLGTAAVALDNVPDLSGTAALADVGGESLVGNAVDSNLDAFSGVSVGSAAVSEASTNAVNSQLEAFDGVTDAGADAAVGASSDFSFGPAVGLASLAQTSTGGPSVTEAVGAGVEGVGEIADSVGSFVSDTAGKGGGGGGGGGKSICTELTRQGFMQPADLANDSKYCNSVYTLEQLQGYHVWAKPVVSVMRKSPLTTAIFRPLARAFAYEACYRLNGSGKHTALGSFLHFAGPRFCGLIGILYFSLRNLTSKEEIPNG